MSTDALVKKNQWLFVITFCVSLPVFSHGRPTQFEYISAKTANQLSDQFQKARDLTPADFAADSKWSCVLYGLHSQMQKKHVDAFYEFHFAEGRVHNLGHHFLKHYEFGNQGLEASQGSVRETVRMSRTQHQLIAMIRIDGDKNPLTVSLCTDQNANANLKL